MIYSEFGLVPLNAVRKLYMLKYWCKLLVTNNCILKHNDGQINWVSEIHKLLTELQGRRNGFVILQKKFGYQTYI